MIAAGDAIEAAGLVGDHAGEDIEPAGRAFRIGDRRDVRRQSQAFDQRDDVDAVGFQHRAGGERKFVEFQFGDPLRDGGARAGQKTGAHAIGDGAETQIEARRLDLIGRERIARHNRAVAFKRRDHAVGQDSLIGRREG